MPEEIGFEIIPGKWKSIPNRWVDVLMSYLYWVFCGLGFVSLVNNMSRFYDLGTLHYYYYYIITGTLGCAVMNGLG